jgi:hypothetical protein
MLPCVLTVGPEIWLMVVPSSQGFGGFGGSLHMLQPPNFWLTKAWPHHSKVLAILAMLCGLWLVTTAVCVANPLDVEGNTDVFVGIILADAVTGFLCLSDSILSLDPGGIEGLVDGLVQVGSEGASCLVLVVR